MLKNVLRQAVNYYDKFDYICMIDGVGIVEYSVIYSSEKREYINENITGMHILEVYPEMNKNDSSILKSLETGLEIHNTLQKLIDFKGKTHYLISSDFPIIQNDKIFGVVEVSKILTQDEYNKFKNGDKRVKINDISTLDDIITENKEYMKLKEKISKIANTNSPVLIEGETGSGKDMVAQALHYESYRRHEPFVAQNCAAIPGNLLESTFFGTIKGAYTGSENRKGLFEIADGGTLFLDELNSMDINLQAKILKALEDGYIRRVGDSKNIKVDVRLVSAMNISPEIAVKKNLLREDLFYRLSVVRVRIPPLKDRKEDIILLSNYFIDKYNDVMNRNVIGMTDMVKNILLNHKWSGNVRELQNVIESIFNLIDGNIISIKDLPTYLYQEIDIPINREYILDREEYVEDINYQKSLNEKVDDYEKTLIEKALKMTNTYVDAAKILRISPQNLQYKLKKYDLIK